MEVTFTSMTEFCLRKKSLQRTIVNKCKKIVKKVSISLFFGNETLPMLRNNDQLWQKLVTPAPRGATANTDDD